MALSYLVLGDETSGSYRDIPISLRTTTTTIMPSKSIDKNNINEYIIGLYEHLTGIIPISFIYILFLCVSVCWIIHTLCCSGEDSHPMDTIGNSKKYKLFSTKVYPKKTILLNVMTSSSTIRNNDYDKKVLEDNHIYIPYRYYQPLVQSGLMEQFIQTILNVNNDKPNHKHRQILEENNLPVSTTSSILSTPPTPTYTEHINIDEDF
ncbi:unnamed protein product [Rotaria magnacalcarata]|uniref:Uncharacterized protein n=2 Tax=Rotaria magnacalcarata TaxID=392030 RepID=A0A816GDQ6_9BILA|nr:unnamed protein product [Rotaria magnacalcarata]